MSRKPNPLDNPEVVDEICARLSGGEAIRNICADQHMPHAHQIYARMAHDIDFSNAIARARQAQQDAIADEIIDMADDATGEDWQVVKLRIWARQWRAAKLAPKKYGDKVTVAGDKDNPIETRRQIELVNAPEEVLRYLAQQKEADDA